MQIKPQESCQKTEQKQKTTPKTELTRDRLGIVYDSSSLGARRGSKSRGHSRSRPRKGARPSGCLLWDSEVVGLAAKLGAAHFLIPQNRMNKQNHGAWGGRSQRLFRA